MDSFALKNVGVFFLLIGKHNFWEKLIEYHILIRTFMMSLSFKQKKNSDKCDFKIEF
jgi:hypothetical protein